MYAFVLAFEWCEAMVIIKLIKLALLHFLKDLKKEDGMLRSVN